MGFFDKLFAKKECNICGAEIGLLGNRKLEDGNLCKECAKKLSPFFSERRHSTVEEIRQQLEYRAENARQLESFSPMHCFGLGYKKIRIDQNQGKFIITSGNDWKDDNPDIISFSQVNSCTIDIDENKRELYRKDNEGRSVSYNPPRYDYSYRFYVELNINSPYFDDIRFELSASEADSPYSPAYQESERESYALQQAMSAFGVNVNLHGGGFRGGFNNGFSNNGFNNQQGGFGANVIAGAVMSALSGNSTASATGNRNWTCECGNLNQGPFCSNCGKKKAPHSPYKCDKCGWELQSMNVPRCCPICGDVINANDIN